MVISTDNISAETSDWPSHYGDQYHVRQSLNSPIVEPPQFDWRISSRERFSSQVLDLDGNLIVCCRGSYVSYVCCFYPNGSLKWQTFLDEWIRSPPLILSDGSIVTYGDHAKSYDICEETIVYSLNKDGTHGWNISLEGRVYSDIIADGSDNIYLGCDGKVISIDSSGNIRWSTPIPGYVESTPAIDKNGMVYFHNERRYDHIWEERKDSHLYALNSDGVIQWKSIANGVHSPMVLSDGRIFLPEYDNATCFFQNGTISWTIDLEEDRFISDPAQDRNGNIFFHTTDHNISKPYGWLKSYYPNGTLRWKVEGMKYACTPLIDGDDNIIFSDALGIHKYSNDGIELWRVPSFIGGSYLLIHPEGWVFISDGNILFRLGQGMYSPPNRPENVYGSFENFWESNDKYLKVSCDIPRFQIYPYINKINLYYSEDNVTFELLTQTINYGDKTWIYYEDKYPERGKKYYFYYTFENDLGESERSDIIELELEPEHRTDPVYIACTITILLVIMILIIHFVRVKTPKSAGTKSI